MKCLIVEDNDLAREGLKFFLADHAEIETAVNGRDAVERFQKALSGPAPFDLVLLDIIMPEMDGQQALKLIRQMEQVSGAAGQRKAIIIMTTALNSPENMEEALWEGDCTDYLVKPIVRADLMAMLRRYRLL
jgi:two-component system, chemotaxis family, chemotaxis protein CheY